MLRRISSAACAVLLVACGGSLDGPAGESDAGDRAEGDGGSTFLDFTPSNIPEQLLTDGTAVVSITTDATIDTNTGEVTGFSLPFDSVFAEVPQVGGPSLAVFSWATLSVEPGITVSVVGDNGLVLALSENATIGGTIRASASLNIAGAGGFAGGDNNTPIGSGPGGGTSVTGRDGGGGGGSLGTLGGAGGIQEGSPAGVAGDVAGTVENAPLIGGSGGGRGGQNADGGLGGGGGGAIQISARGEIQIGATGGIDVGGGPGTGGDNDRAGGGGGAGGAILLEARSVISLGTLAANGGGGGAGAEDNTKGADGTPGGFGAVPSPGGASVGDDGTEGGAGAAVDIMSGQAGTSGTGNTGGGGGGAGRIYVRTDDPASVTGVVSPALSIALGTI